MSDIEEIKAKISIVDLVGSKIQLKKAGRNFKALCPFHNEKTPSFMVSPERQTFHCFGCAKGGTVFDWVMEYEHVDFVEALETLAEKAGITLSRRFDDTPENKKKNLLYEIHHIASEYYHYILTSHPLGEKARYYLKKRGISDKTIETFSLGYSPNSWDALQKFLQKKGYDPDIRVISGLCIESSRGGYDRFRGRLMFALRDHRSRVIGFSGRVLDPEVKEAKYINSPETPIYTKGNVLFGLDVTKSSIIQTGSAILVEGEFDLISSFQEGISNIVAIKGSALTEGHIHLLHRFTDSLYFALDADMAGDQAARRGIELADKAGFDMKVIQIPGGKDPDEAVRENPVLFKKAIHDAEPIYDYFIRSAISRYDVKSAAGKKKISDELLPMLAKIENSIVQSHYLKIIAETLDVSEQIITDGVKRLSKNDYVKYEPQSTPKTEIEQLSAREKLEIYLVALIVQTKTAELFDDVKEYFQSSDFTNPAIRRLLEILEEYLTSHSTFLVGEFADFLPKELHSMLDHVFLWDLSDIVGNEELAAKEWANTLHELRRQVYKQKLVELTRSMESEGSESQDPAVIQSQIADLTSQLRALEKISSV